MKGSLAQNEVTISIIQSQSDPYARDAHGYKYDVELLRTIFDGFITSILEVCLYNYMKCNVSDLIML